MTIFSSKHVKKSDQDNDTSVGVVPEWKLLVSEEKEKIEKPTTGSNDSSTATVLVVRRRQSMFRLSVLLLSLIILLMIIVLGCTMIYRNLLQAEMMYRGVCGVHYSEESYDDSDDNDSNLASGEFEQEVYIKDMEHERIEVPRIGDTRRATVLHDFNKNVTAIIDKEQSYCFLLPLNRTLVKPPRDFMDLLVKLKTGYYIPDVEIIRENYRALMPPLQDLTPYGYSIKNECQLMRSYWLVPEGEPLAISKRSAEWCEFVGEKWCLGDGGADRMLCININSCM